MPDERLLGAAEIAHMLHVPGADLVIRWSRQYKDFPKPIVRNPGPRWALEEIERWAEARGWRG